MTSLQQFFDCYSYIPSSFLCSGPLPDHLTDHWSYGWLWLLGTFANFSADQIEFLSFASASYSLPITHHNAFNSLASLIPYCRISCLPPIQEKEEAQDSPQWPPDLSTSDMLLMFPFPLFLWAVYILVLLILSGLPLPLSGHDPSDWLT
jgi:hypothetical protein